MTPSVGRIVHYHSDYPEPLAAIITKVVKRSDDRWALLSEWDVWLAVFGAGESLVMFVGPITHGEGPGQWSWPPRVS